MSLTAREWWGVIHGMGLGAVFLLAFAGGLAGLYSLKPALITPEGVVERMRRLEIGVVAMAPAWGTVITGTWIVYPWYRAKSPEGATDLSQFPRSYLLADPNLAAWHTFGMEWKEHVSWLAPMLATAVAYVVVRYGAKLADEPKIRQALIVLFSLAFATAAVGGLFGAFLNKVAPIR